MDIQIDGTRRAGLDASPMTAHLLSAMQAGEDIGYYGRLAFALIARRFLEEGELIRLLTTQPGVDESAARAVIGRVEKVQS